jgi:hypothetical protein
MVKCCVFFEVRTEFQLRLQTRHETSEISRWRNTHGNMFTEGAIRITVRISRESPCGVEAAMVRFEGKVYWWVGLKGCYWWKTVWHTSELHYYIQTENIKQLRVACSECTFTVFCGCCDNILDWITLNSSEHMKDYCLLFVQWLWNKCFQDG